MKPSKAVEEMARRLARKSDEMVGTDEASAYLMFFKEIKSAFRFLEDRVREEMVEKVKSMRLLSVAKYGNILEPHDPTYLKAYNDAVDAIIIQLSQEESK